MHLVPIIVAAKKEQHILRLANEGMTMMSVRIAQFLHGILHDEAGGGSDRDTIMNKYQLFKTSTARKEQLAFRPKATRIADSSFWYGPKISRVLKFYSQNVARHSDSQRECASTNPTLQSITGQRYLVSIAELLCSGF